MTTREVSLRYQGFFQTSGGLRKAYLRFEDEMLVLNVDENVVDDWKVAEIRSRELMLTGPGGEEVRLDFNQDEKLEVSLE